MQLYRNRDFRTTDQCHSLVSIICPVYQAEKTLNECLGSILSQTYRDWECIIIVDGATDSSEAIAKRYAQADSRFIVKTQENRGRSAARNHGLSYAKGAWIAFIDSDDQFLPGGLNAMMQIAHEYHPDIVYGNYLLRSSMPVTMQDHFYAKGILNLNFARTANLNIERLGLSNDGYRYDLFNCRTCWGKLYSRNLLIWNSIHFPEKLRIGEDTVFNYFVLSSALRAAFTNEPVYIYNNMSEGTVRSFSPKDFASILLMSRLFENLSRIDNTWSGDMRACLARDYLGVFMRGSLHAPLHCINQVCRLAQKAYSPFIHHALPLYISRGMKISRYKFIYNKIRIWLIRHHFWRIAFLLQRIGGKLNNGKER